MTNTIQWKRNETKQKQQRNDQDGGDAVGELGALPGSLDRVVVDLGSKYLSTSSSVWLPYIDAMTMGVSCATGPSSSTYGNAAMLSSTLKLSPRAA